MRGTSPNEAGLASRQNNVEMDDVGASLIQRPSFGAPFNTFPLTQQPV